MAHDRPLQADGNADGNTDGEHQAVIGCCSAAASSPP